VVPAVGSVRRCRVISCPRWAAAAWPGAPALASSTVVRRCPLRRPSRRPGDRLLRAIWMRAVFYAGCYVVRGGRPSRPPGAGSGRPPAWRESCLAESCRRSVPPGQERGGAELANRSSRLLVLQGGSGRSLSSAGRRVPGLPLSDSLVVHERHPNETRRRLFQLVVGGGSYCLVLQ